MHDVCVIFLFCVEVDETTKDIFTSTHSLDSCTYLNVCLRNFARKRGLQILQKCREKTNAILGERSAKKAISKGLTDGIKNGIEFSTFFNGKARVLKNCHPIGR